MFTQLNAKCLTTDICKITSIKLGGKLGRSILATKIKYGKTLKNRKGVTRNLQTRRIRHVI